MKKRFLPFSLLLVIMIFGQPVMADQTGHYVPRAKENSSAEAYLNSIRANQQTGLIDPAWLIAAAKQTENSTKDYADLVYWTSMGPDNMGGRTTSVLYNNQNNNEVFIGSMGGGVFYTWNLGISWHQVGENLMVSCMVQAEDGTIYVGTGDGGVAHEYNTLSELGFENSFIGSGLYKLNLQTKEMTLVEGTDPTDPNNAGTEWGFINDIAIDGDNIIVATGDGVRYLKDGVWEYAKVGEEALEGNATSVKVGYNHVVVAAVDRKIYIGQLDDMQCKSGDSDVVNDSTNVMSAIGVAGAVLDVAVAPTVVEDEDGNKETINVIYAANINSDGNHVKFYVSEDGGETWTIILPTVSEQYGHQVYSGKGCYNHGIVIDPRNSDRIYVTAKNLWLLERPESGTGYYVALQLSSASSLHIGVNALAFSPKKSGEAYVGTDGGIYKAKSVDNTYFSFTNCNRGYISTRCLTVAPSGKNTRVVASTIDQGPILINGLEGTNNMSTGDLLNPGDEITGAHFGVFQEKNISSSCIVSTIQPKAILYATYGAWLNTNNKKIGLYRTKSAGVDYDLSNFVSQFGDNGVLFSGYRIPMAYWETLNDEYSTDEVWFKCKQDQKAGDEVVCYSSTGDFSTSDGYFESGYPFYYTLPQDMYYNEEEPEKSDSIAVQDPISSKLVIPYEYSKRIFYIYYTLDGIRFGKVTKWYKIATITGNADYAASPTCMAMSEDGDVLVIGTRAHGLVRISNLRQAVDENTADPSSDDFAPVVTEIALPNITQYVTSVSLYSEDANKLVVTLGNYGNENYVLYCDNFLGEEPTFEEKQGDLPAMPVFSSVYTSTYDGADEGHVLVGTEHGVYRTTDITAESPVWTLESKNMGDVPVMDMKQQLIYEPETTITVLVDSIPTQLVYPGTNNQGVIYAATYGRGLFRCETYRQHSGASVPETPVVAESKVSMYPNPVRDAAKVCFELNGNTAVSYQVYDMSGRMVKTESLGNFAEGKHEVSVSMSKLSKGAYVLRLNAGSKSSSVKFMVF